jgi:hypothetical protein
MTEAARSGTFWAKNRSYPPSMLWRDRQARGYFLGQFPDDDLDDAWTTPDEPSGEADDLRFAAALEEAEPHLDGIEVSRDTEVHDRKDAGAHQQEQSRVTAMIEPDDAATAAMRPVRRAAPRRSTSRRRTRRRRSRVAALVTVVAVLLAGTGLYVRGQADAVDKRVHRPTSTSLDQQSTPTTADAAPSDATPSTESAATPVVPGSSPGPPRGTSSSRSPGPTTGSPSESTSATAPGATSAPPADTSPPSAPPRSPTCQLLPVICP